MRYFLALAAIPVFVSARPIRTRAASAASALVFNFANVLNQLESQFYTQALSKFSSSDFDAAGFTTDIIPSQIFTAIQSEEATHLSTLQQTLIDNGATPLNCSFNFDSALTDVTTMAATARVVEYLGVAAFQGGAVLIDDPVLLDAAGSILTVESRHSTLLNILSGTGSAIPQAFDLAFTPSEVLAIAGGFISGDCPLGIPASNTLTVTNTGAISQGTLLTVSGTNISGTDNLFCNIATGGMPFTMNMPLSQCVVPPGVNGPVALWITSDDNPLVNNVVDRDTSKQVAGPALFFVDSSPEMLGQLVRGSGGSSSSSSGGDSSSSSNSSSSGSSSSSDGSNGSTSPPAAAGAAPPAGSDSPAPPPAPASTPLPPDYTGPSPDGHVDVNGVSSVAGTPAVATPAASASASGANASASASDSAASPSASASSS